MRDEVVFGVSPTLSYKEFMVEAWSVLSEDDLGTCVFVQS